MRPSRPLCSAVRTIVEIVGNVVVCTLVVWVASYLWSVGNVFSGSPAKSQSRESFLAVSLATSHVVASMMAIANQTIVLCSVHSARDQTHSPTPTLYALRLFVESRITIIATLLFIIAMPFLVSLASAST